MRFLFIAGDYYSGPPGDLDQDPDEDWVRSRQNEGRAYQEWDEDADVDESGEVLPGLEFKPQVISESLSPERFCQPQVAIVLSPGTFLGRRQGARSQARTQGVYWHNHVDVGQLRPNFAIKTQCVGT